MTNPVGTACPQTLAAKDKERPIAIALDGSKLTPHLLTRGPRATGSIACVSLAFTRV